MKACTAVCFSTCSIPFSCGSILHRAAAGQSTAVKRKRIIDSSWQLQDRLFVTGDARALRNQTSSFIHCSMLPGACMLVAHASKASRAKRSAAGIVTPFVSCASTDHGDSQQLSLHFSISGLLYSTHFIYIIILALLYAKILRFQRAQTLVNKRWPSVAAQLYTLLQNTIAATYDDVS